MQPIGSEIGTSTGTVSAPWPWLILVIDIRVRVPAQAVSMHMECIAVNWDSVQSKLPCLARFLFFFERHNGNGQPPKLVPRCMAQNIEVTATKRLHQGSIGAYWLWGYPTIKVRSRIECPTLQREIHLRRLPCGAFYTKDTRSTVGLGWHAIPTKTPWWFSAGIEPATAELIGRRWLSSFSRILKPSSLQAPE